MLKKLIILLFAIAPLAAFAQEKIAYINTQEIFSLMPELKGIESQMATKQEEVQKNAQALETEYNKKMEEFSKVANPSDAVRQDQQKQLAQIQERYQLFVQNSQKEAQEMQQKLIAPVHKKIADAIKAVGDEKGFTYILDLAAGAIVYQSDKSTNATPLVKAKLGIK